MTTVHLGPSRQGDTKADVVVLEVSVVSDDEPRVGEQRDQGQGRGGEAGGSGGRRPSKRASSSACAPACPCAPRCVPNPFLKQTVGVN